MTRRRHLLAGTLILILAECLFFLYLVAFGWSFRSLMLNPGDPEIAIRTRTVGTNAVWLALNVIGGVAYIYRRDGFGRYAILVVLASDIVNSLFAAVAAIALNNDPGNAIGWIIAALIPAAALVLVWQQGRKARTT